jgi:hypothetical protein
MRIEKGSGLAPDVEVLIAAGLIAAPSLFTWRRSGG